jgi:hypothetical protein
LSLTAVGWRLIHDPIAFEQVKSRESLAQLARLGVAEVDALPDPERIGRIAEQRGLHLAGALLAVES